MNPLLTLEKSVLAEGREWTRRRLEQQMQELAQTVALVCPQTGQALRDTRAVPLTLITPVGEVKIKVGYGRSALTRRWVNPVREAWGLRPHQRGSPELERRLSKTAPDIGSYAKAAAVAGEWGCAISDDFVHEVVQRVAERLEGAELSVMPAPVLERPFTLVVMMDGWMVRERGPHWGASARKKGAERVAWHEVKSAIIWRLEQRVQTASGRGFLVEKYVVAREPETKPVDFGAAVQAEALRRGLGRAAKVLVVIDGAVWLWNVAEDRFAEATLELDFHHASEHLWAIAHELFGQGTPAAESWAKPLLRRLKNGEAARVVQSLEALLEPMPTGPVPSKRLQVEVTYFQTHRDHMPYRQVAREGGPIGSGAMESLCSQLQNRFKRTGQFWTRPGLRHLLAVDVAVRNKDFDCTLN